MSSLLLAAYFALSGGVIGDPHGCPEPAHGDHEHCICDREGDFYRPPPPRGPIYAHSPGVRVYGRPITVPGPVVYIEGPPVYVDAPPIRVAPADIYVGAPDVRVRPSDIIVEPPNIHFEDCRGGGTCRPE